MLLYSALPTCQPDVKRNENCYLDAPYFIPYTQSKQKAGEHVYEQANFCGKRKDCRSPDQHLNGTRVDHKTIKRALPRLRKCTF